MNTTLTLPLINAEQKNILAENSLQIEISANNLLTLINHNYLTVNQVKCLNLKTKHSLWSLLLKSCF